MVTVVVKSSTQHEYTRKGYDNRAYLATAIRGRPSMRSSSLKVEVLIGGMSGKKMPPRAPPMTRTSGGAV